MAQKKHTMEQIIGKLCEAEVALSKGLGKSLPRFDKPAIEGEHKHRYFFFFKYLEQLFAGIETDNHAHHFGYSAATATATTSNRLHSENR